MRTAPMAGHAGSKPVPPLPTAPVRRRFPSRAGAVLMAVLGGLALLGCSFHGGSVDGVSRLSNERPAAAGGGDTSTTSDQSQDPGGEAPRQIELEDVDAVKEANRRSSWSDKLDMTVVTSSAVTLVAAPDTALSADEALDACEAMRRSLVRIDPEVTVSIRRNDVELASSPESGTCSAA